jgi:hypothetical protein
MSKKQENRKLISQNKRNRIINKRYTSTIKTLTKLNHIHSRITRIENSLDNPEEFIYDECSDLKRNIQLETEVMIAEIKKSNEIDLNSDETQLEPELFNLIQNVKEQSQTLITTIDDHEKVIKSFCV